MTRTVLDTNIFIPAFLLPGHLNRLADPALQGAFTWLISDDIFEEYVAVASRPIFKQSPDNLEAILYRVKELACRVPAHSRFQVVLQDPSDDKFLACAVDGRADWIISGDRHLLALKKFRGVRIGSPSEFLQNF